MPGCLSLSRLRTRLRIQRSGNRRPAPNEAPPSETPPPDHNAPDLNGLFLLYPEEEVGDSKVDIVAVHGLNGDSLRTWTHQPSGTIWLQHLLPHDFSNCRIMTFGYDSAFAFSRSVSGIEDFALDLLNYLRMRRETATTRPIIFICHSLGGIVVKKALVLAHDRSDVYGDILSSCCGIIFMSTPHRGSDAASWGKLVQLIESLTLSVNFRGDLVKSLKCNSKALGEISRQFVQSSIKFPIRSFYELHLTHPFPTPIVTKDSALLNIPNELVYPMGADHCSICKFPGANQAYQLVRCALRELVDNGLRLVNQEVEGISHSTSNLTASPFSNFSVRFQLPKARNHGFSGREDLLGRLHLALGHVNDPAPLELRRRTAILHGLGGIGKTQIVIEYAYRYCSLFSSIFWIDATSQTTLSQSALAMAERLVSHYRGPPGSGGPDYADIGVALGLWGCIAPSGRINLEGKSPEQLIRGMRDWLSSENNTQWLVIFDNNDDISTVSHTDIIPVGEFGSVIFSTRNPELQQLGVGIEVGEIEMEAGISILLASAKRDPSSLDTPERREAEEIAEKLSYLPLALDQAGGYISAKQIPFSRYLLEYDSKFEAMATNAHVALLERYKHPFYTTFKISVDSLCSSSRQLLHLCAFLGTRDIVEKLFRKGNVQDSLDDGLGDLLLYSLAKRTGPGRDIISFHPLVLEVARRSLSENEQLQYAEQALILLVEAVTYTGVKETSDWIFEQEISAHIDTGVDNMRRFLQSEQWDPNTASAVSSIAKFYRFREHLDSAEELSKRAIQHHEIVDIDEFAFDTHRIYAISALGMVCHAQAKFAETLRWLERALAGCEKALGQDHPYTLQIVFSMAITYTGMHRYDAALEFYKRALAGSEKEYGNEHHDTLDTIHRIAIILNRQTKFDNALEWFWRALVGSEKTLGKEHPDTLLIVSNMAVVFNNQGKHDKSLEWCERALLGCENTLEGEHPITLTIVYQMAGVFKSRGDNDSALESFKRVLAGRENALGKEHLDTLDVVNNMAIIFSTQGKYDEAFEWFQRTLAGCETALGKNHRETLAVVGNIAYMFKTRGKHDTALEWFQRTLAGREIVLGKDHPDTIQTAHMIAAIENELEVNTVT